MAKRIITATILFLFHVCVAVGYEYHLQVTQSSTVAIGLQFNADGTVGGNYDSWSNVFCGGGKYRTICARNYDCQTAVWDTQGNLISTASLQTLRTGRTGPDPCPVNGSVQYTTSATTPAGTPADTEDVYASNGTSTTGQDTRGFGYIDVQSSHITKQTANCPACVIPDAPDSFQITYLSDGDFPVNFSSITPALTFSSIYNNGQGAMTVTQTGQPDDCLAGPVSPGSTCNLNVTYDPTTIRCTSYYQGYAYEGWSISLVTDAGNLPDATWTAHFTITGVQRCDE